MNKTPHFVLFSRTGGQSAKCDAQGGRWYFRIESATGAPLFEASDVEADLSRERLELLAVVRGLEALDQPSSVTLITGSRQISRAVRQGLEYWRVRDWKWERFGQKVPMKNGDLWERVDRAMKIHDIRCRSYRIDSAHTPARRPKTGLSRRGVQRTQRRSRILFSPLVLAARWTAHAMHGMANALQKLIPEGSPRPHPSM